MSSAKRRPAGIFVLNADAYSMVYSSPDIQDAIRSRVEIIATFTAEQLKSNLKTLAEVDFIFSGWGCPLMDAEFLKAAPHLKAVFYAAGAIHSWATTELFHRGIVVTTAQEANAIPVAEYTLSSILFSLKHGWQLARQTREQRRFVPRDGAPGNYRRTVGLIGFGAIGQLVATKLAGFDLRICVYDPFLPEQIATAAGVKLVTLGQLFRESDVVSLHAPEVPETFRMVNGDLIRSMKPGATLINSSRGSLIDEDAMIRVLRERSDLQVVLDVTDPEPPAEDSPLYTLRNVMLTPHIAGSVGQECQRMGQYMIDELQRYLAGKPLRWQAKPPVTKAAALHLSGSEQLNQADLVA